MKSVEKYNELLDFILYQAKSNPEIKLKEIIPLLNEVLHRIGEPKVKGN